MPTEANDLRAPWQPCADWRESLLIHLRFARQGRFGPLRPRTVRAAAKPGSAGILAGVVFLAGKDAGAPRLWDKVYPGTMALAARSSASASLSVPIVIRR